MTEAVQAVVLFGSRARGVARDDSDVDIGVLATTALSADSLGAVALDASAQVGVSEDKIDIVELRRASPLLCYRVAEEGKLLSGDPGAFLRFRVRAWRDYLDTAKFRRLRERALEERYA